MRFALAWLIAVARLKYAVLKLLPVRHRVVMMSRQSDVPSRDFRMLAAELKRQDPSLEVVMHCRFVHKGLVARAAYLVDVIVQMYLLATSEACIADGYILPVSVLDHRAGFTVIQMWHALGAVKKFGYQSVGRTAGRAPALAAVMRMHRNYDFVICGGDESISAFAEAFDVDPAIVLPLGLPRIDDLLAHAQQPDGVTLARLEELSPGFLAGGAVRVLYAPTFRRHRPPSLDEVVRRFGGEGYVLMVKAHELDRVCVAGTRAIDVSAIDVQDLLPACDVVITDYSAVAFEAAVLAKPVLFYVHDHDEYVVDNGLNIDPLADLSSVSSRDIDEIGSWVDAGCENRCNDERVAAALRLTPHAQPGRTCTESIADLVMSRIAVDRGRSI